MISVSDSQQAPSSLELQRGIDESLQFYTYAAIWDNRSVYHTMTLDYEGLGDRFGNRAVGIGEKPYYDPKSSSRRVDLEVPFLQ